MYSPVGRVVCRLGPVRLSISPTTDGAPEDLEIVGSAGGVEQIWETFAECRVDPSDANPANATWRPRSISVVKVGIAQ
jgi:hypothetical protein